MTPSVPDWGLGRAFGVGETGAGWGLWPWSARQGANGPIGGGSGTRTSACTDISPTSLHHRKRLVHQCRVEIPLTVWKTGSTVFLVNRQLGRSPEVVASVRRARTARVLDAPAPRSASLAHYCHRAAAAILGALLTAPRGLGYRPGCGASQSNPASAKLR